MSSNRPAKLKCPSCETTWIVPVPPASPAEFRQLILNHHESTGHFGTMNIDQTIQAVLSSMVRL